MKKTTFLMCIFLAMLASSCRLEPLPGPCPPDEHDQDGVCVPNTPTECGKDVVNCLDIPGVRSANCIKGNCSASQCLEGFHKIKDDKEDDDLPNVVVCTKDTLKDCGPTLLDCESMGGVNEVECKNGICVAIDCQTGFFKNNNVCLLNNVKDCGADSINCMTQFSNYEEIKCNKNQCVLISCKAGFHINNNNCEKDTAEACGVDSNNNPVNCNAMIGENHIASMECQNGKCQITECEIGYEIVNEDRCE